MRKQAGRWVVVAFAAATLFSCAAPSLEPLLTVQLSQKWYEVPADSLQNIQSGWSVDGTSADRDVVVSVQQAWSLSPNTVAADFFTNTAPQRLQAYTQTRALQESEVSGLSANSQSIQDVVVLVSDRSVGDGLDVRRNDVSVVDGLTYLDQELAWDFAGVTQTIYVRAAADLDSKTLTIFWLRCSDSCIADVSETVSNVLEKLTRAVGVS
jgi:hypothetical protein